MYLVLLRMLGESTAGLCSYVKLTFFQRQPSPLFVDCKTKELFGDWEDCYFYIYMYLFLIPSDAMGL